jgi:hypothetical protein
MADRRISPDEARSLRSAERDGRLLKVASSAPASWDAGKRSARFTMTSQRVDRMGDTVMTAGIDTTEFMKNPVAFVNHDSASWPVGLWSSVQKYLFRAPPHMEGDLVLAASGGPIAQIDEAGWAIEHGLARACSIGFLPDWSQVEKALDAKGIWDGGLIFHKAELLECSLCGIPANPAALAKGFAPQAKGTRSFDKAVAQRLRQLEVDAIKKRGGGHGSG